MIRYLSIEQVLFIHEKALEFHGGPRGLRDRSALESALKRPQMSAFGEDAYPTLFLKVAALLHSLVQNHPFVDGNKRAAFGSMHMMLLVNGYDLASSTNVEVKMVLRVATGKLDVEGIVSWLEYAARKRKK